MFENLKLQPEDKIMALMSLFKADERKEKIAVSYTHLTLPTIYSV